VVKCFSSIPGTAKKKKKREGRRTKRKEKGADTCLARGKEKREKEKHLCEKVHGGGQRQKTESRGHQGKGQERDRS
jgi:hypothetical protein